MTIQATSQDTQSESVQPPQIDKKLLDSISALKAVVTTHNLLHEGQFRVDSHVAIMASISFLKTLHEQILEEALQHPQASLIEELKSAVKSPQSKEVK